MSVLQRQMGVISLEPLLRRLDGEAQGLRIKGGVQELFGNCNEDDDVPMHCLAAFGSCLDAFSQILLSRNRFQKPELNPGDVLRGPSGATRFARPLCMLDIEIGRRCGVCPCQEAHHEHGWPFAALTAQGLQRVELESAKYGHSWVAEWAHFLLETDLMPVSPSRSCRSWQLRLSAVPSSICRSGCRSTEDGEKAAVKPLCRFVADLMIAVS